MDFEKIAGVVSVVLSAIATIIATLRKNTKSKTIEDIEAKAEAKKAKYIAKACKKNHIEVDTTTKSEDTKTIQQNITTNNEQQKVNESYWKSIGGINE